MKTLKGEQIINAMKSNKYIIVRMNDGNVYGVNCGILRNKKVKDRLESKIGKRTNTVSFRQCGLNEYISTKVPFYTQQ